MLTSTLGARGHGRRESWDECVPGRADVRLGAWVGRRLGCGCECGYVCVHEILTCAITSPSIGITLFLLYDSTMHLLVPQKNNNEKTGKKCDGGKYPLFACMGGGTCYRTRSTWLLSKDGGPSRQPSPDVKGSLGTPPPGGDGGSGGGVEKKTHVGVKSPNPKSMSRKLQLPTSSCTTCCNTSTFIFRPRQTTESVRV